MLSSLTSQNLSSQNSQHFNRIFLKAKSAKQWRLLPEMIQNPTSELQRLKFSLQWSKLLCFGITHFMTWMSRWEAEQALRSLKSLSYLTEIRSGSFGSWRRRCCSTWSCCLHRSHLQPSANSTALSRHYLLSHGAFRSQWFLLGGEGPRVGLLEHRDLSSSNASRNDRWSFPGSDVFKGT